MPVTDEYAHGFVRFPSTKRVLGARPMQFVQFDIVSMEDSDYSDRCYTKLLLVTDLYSQYMFGRALPDNADHSLIVRHLMDIFAAFGPPEGYFVHCGDHQLINECFADIQNMFNTDIFDFGPRKKSDCSVIRKMIYQKAEVELGAQERWVEAIPFAIMRHNQTPSVMFEVPVSPFEVMFSRRAWRNECSPPPWMGGAEAASAFGLQNSFGENGDGTRMGIRGKDSASTGPLRAREQMSRLLNVSEDKFSPCNTGYVYQVGDRVYVKNPIAEEGSKIKRKAQRPPEHVRAVIADVDLRNPHLPYRVYYRPRDTSEVDDPPEFWPDETNGVEMWVSPFEITGAKWELNRSRNVKPPPLEWTDSATQTQIQGQRRSIAAQATCPRKDVSTQVVCNVVRMGKPMSSASTSTPLSQTIPMARLVGTPGSVGGSPRMVTVPVVGVPARQQMTVVGKSVAQQQMFQSLPAGARIVYVGASGTPGTLNIPHKSPLTMARTPGRMATTATSSSGTKDSGGKEGAQQKPSTSEPIVPQRNPFKETAAQTPSGLKKGDKEATSTTTPAERIKLIRAAMLTDPEAVTGAAKTKDGSAVRGKMKRKQPLDVGLDDDEVDHSLVKEAASPKQQRPMARRTGKKVGLYGKKFSPVKPSPKKSGKKPAPPSPPAKKIRIALKAKPSGRGRPPVGKSQGNSSSGDGDGQSPPGSPDDPEDRLPLGLMVKRRKAQQDQAKHQSD